MPEIDVPQLPDGKPDLEKFSGHPVLVQIKNLVDGLRGGVNDQKSRADAAILQVSQYEKLGSLEQIQNWKKLAETSTESTKLLEQYNALGKPEEIGERLKQADVNAQVVADYKRSEVVAKAATVAGVNATALAEIAKLKNLEFEIGKVSVAKGDKTEEVAAAFVKVDGKNVALTDYIKSDLAAFEASLNVAAKPASGTSVVPQPSGSGQSVAEDAWLDNLVAGTKPQRPAFNPFSTQQPQAQSDPNGGKT